MNAPARKTLRNTLRRIVADYPSVHVLGESLELSPATSGLLGAHPDRVHLLPAADATLVGTAVGMALTGAKPIVELAGGASLWGALQQLGQEAGALTSQEFAVSVVVRVPLAPGETAPLDLLAGLDGVTVAAASSADTAAELLERSMDARGPVVLLEPAEAMARSGHTGGGPLGEARTLQQGDHVSLIAFGSGVGAALDAAARLAEEGISADVVDLRTVSPLDIDTVGASIRHTGRPVLVGTPAAAVAVAIQAGFLRLESPPVAVAADTDAIIQAVHNSISY